MKTTIDPDSYVFDFSLFKGQKYKDVRKSNPDFIRWCHEEVSDWTLDDEELKVINEEVSRGIAPDLYVFTFGQYRGFRFEQVLRISPGYLLWAHDTVPFFKMRPTEVWMASELSLNREAVTNLLADQSNVADFVKRRLEWLGTIVS